MKKIVISVLVFMAVTYAMPIITVGFTEKYSGSIIYFEDDYRTEEEVETEVLHNEAEGFDEKTRVTLQINGKVCEMSVRDYLIGVVAAEMPASFPIEALKAQAVAARSYMLYKMENGEKDKTHSQAQLCDDYEHCTAFMNIEEQGEKLWGDNKNMYYEKIKNAVESTDGIVATYEGKPIAAVFHSASASFTEAAVNVWGTEYKYLTGVSSDGGEMSPDYYGTLQIKSSDFADTIKRYYPNAVFTGSPSAWFADIVRSDSGSILSIKVGGIKMSGSEIRKVLNLNSANFTIEIGKDEIVFNTVGTGHGVGMSQYGARKMALDGAYFDEIICHYYTGVKLMVKN